MPNQKREKRRRSDRWLDLSVALILILVTVSLYWPAAGFDFINTDDNLYVYENPTVKAGLTLKGGAWAFSSFEVANWHPLTWLSHMLDVELFGMNAGGHHFTSILLHALNALLLMYLLIRMTDARWPSLFVAALFAIHPLHVESVAWVSERKDVLSTFFWLLSSLAYAGYVRKPGVFRYLGIVTLFILGIMSKPMLVTLPFVFLLMDYWPLERFPAGNPGNSHQRASIRWLIYEKIPFLIISLVSCGVTWSAQASYGAVKTLDMVPLSTRITNALVSYASYLVKVLWPFPLAFHYPLPDSIQWAKFTFSTLLIISISIVAVRYAKRYPYIITGWLWYLGTLVPVIGIVQVGNQAMADRYTYIPLTGVFIIIAWGCVEFTAKRGRSAMLISVALSVGWIAILSFLTRHQVYYWKNSTSLLSHTVRVTVDNYGAHLNLGLALSVEGRLDEAIQHYRKVLEIRPQLIEAACNLGHVYEKQGKLRAAAEQYQEAIRIDPDFSGARYNLGNLYDKQGMTDEAIEQYRLALQNSPNDIDILNNLGNMLIDRGKYKEAIQSFRKALEITPENGMIRNNLGVALFRQGQLGAARKMFEGIINTDPDYAEAYYNLGFVYEKQGRVAKAGLYYGQALQVDPGHQDARSGRQRVKDAMKLNEQIILNRLKNDADNAELYYQLGEIRKGTGDLAAAHDSFQRALSIDPGFIEALLGLGITRARQSRYEAALEALMRAVVIQPDHAMAHYYVAAIYSRRNEVEDSLRWLRLAVVKGFHNWDLLKSDPNMANIRGSDGYKWANREK